MPKTSLRFTEQLNKATVYVEQRPGITTHRLARAVGVNLCYSTSHGLTDEARGFFRELEDDRRFRIERGTCVETADVPVYLAGYVKPAKPPNYVVGSPTYSPLEVRIDESVAADYKNSAIDRVEALMERWVRQKRPFTLRQLCEAAQCSESLVHEDLELRGKITAAIERMERQASASPKQLLEAALQELIAEGNPFSLAALSDRAGVHQNAIYKIPELKAAAQEASRQLGRPDPASARLERALNSLIAEGKPFTLSDVCHRADSGNSVIHKHPEIKARALEAIRQLKPPTEVQEQKSTRERLETALEEIIAEGKPFRLIEVTRRACIHKAALHKHPDLKDRATRESARLQLQQPEQERQLTVRERLERALDALIAEGKPFQMIDITQRAGVPKTSLYNYPQIKERADAALKAIQQQAAIESERQPDSNPFWSAPQPAISLAPVPLQSPPEAAFNPDYLSHLKAQEARFIETLRALEEGIGELGRQRDEMVLNLASVQRLIRVHDSNSIHFKD